MNKTERATTKSIRHGLESHGGVESVPTIFAVPKPFKGHIGIIQRNAIESWTRLEPRPEIILFGDELGTAETCAQLGLRHEPRMARTEFGAPRLDDVFGRARELASSKLLAYVNADIILIADFLFAVQQISNWKAKFLMVGRRTDLDILAPWDFSQPDSTELMKNWALGSGKQRSPKFIDYFVFTEDLAVNLLPLALGRVGFDNFFIWHATSLQAPVVDASHTVTAIHQNHDYSHHPLGFHGVYLGEEGKNNYALIGGWGRHYSTAHATHVLLPDRVQRNWLRWVEITKRPVQAICFSFWFAFLNSTRPLRHRFGLRRRETN